MKRYLILLISVILITSLSAVTISESLSNMDYAKKRNAMLTLEVLNFKVAEYQINKNELFSKIVTAENYWNSGQYSKAINLIKEIEKYVNLAAGISWKTPNYTPLKKWGQDVAVTPPQYDIKKVELVKAAGNNNLFVVALGLYSWWIFISTDGGNTWAETYQWGATVPIRSVDLAEAANGYVYIAYAFQNFARIRRAYENDGQIDNNFSYVTVFTVADSVKEVNLEPDRLSSDRGLCYGAIDFSYNLLYFYSADSGKTWIDLSPGITNADRGLDMDYGWFNTGAFLWLSYISTKDSLCAAGRGTGVWNIHTNITLVNSASYYKTAIAMRGDTIIILYPEASNGYLNYFITYNAGTNWYYGTIYDTTAASQYDVTARGDEGWQVVFCNFDPSGPEIMKYRHRTYRLGAWDSVVSFGQQDAWFNFKSSIEYLGSPGAYGVVYINDNYDVYFNRMDWTSIGEKYTSRNINNTSEILKVSSLSGRNLKFSIILSKPSKIMLDIYSSEGRKIGTIVNSQLTKGVHTYLLKNNLKPGKYFLRLKTGNLKETKSVIILR